MKRTIRILTMTLAVLALSLPGVMAEKSAELSSSNLEVLTEVVSENAVILEEWMIEAPATEKVIELQDWMIEPFDIKGMETAIVLEDWMLLFS